MYKRQVSIFSDGNVYRQRYEKGKAVNKLEIVDHCEKEKTGTMISFLPDKEIFEETVYDYNILKQRLREMAFLTKNLKIILRDVREEEIIEKEFHYEGGIKAVSYTHLDVYKRQILFITSV